MDGDGQLSRTDVQHHMSNLMTVLTYGLPSTAGFGAGFFIGIKKG